MSVKLSIWYAYLICRKRELMLMTLSNAAVKSNGNGIQGHIYLSVAHVSLQASN